MATAAIGLVPAHAQPPREQPETPQQCVAFGPAISQSQRIDPRIDASRATRDIARSTLLATRSQTKPQISLFGRTGQGEDPLLQAETDTDNGTRVQAGIQMTQELYSFGARRMALEAARAETTSANFQLDETRNSVAEGAAIAFLNLQRAMALFDLAQEAEEALGAEAASVESRLDRQVLTVTEASEIRTRAAIARSETLIADVEVEKAKVRLSVLLNQEVPCIDDLSAEVFLNERAGNLLNMPDRYAVQEAIRRSATVKRAQADVTAAQARLGQTRRANLPVLSGYALQIYDNELTGATRTIEDQNGNPITVDQDYEVFEDETRVGLTLTQPLFTGGRVRSERLDARAQLSRAQANERLEKIIVEDIVRQSLAQAKAEQHARIALLEARNQAFTQLQATQRAFDLGSRTLTDLVLAQEAYFEAAQLEVTARFDFYTSLVRVYGATGLLAADLPFTR